MASGKKSRKRPARRSLAEDIDTNAKAVLFAHSVAASAQDGAKDAIFRCIVAAFDNQGLTHITGLADRVVWQRIPDDVADELARLIRACVRGAVSDPGDLSGPFAVLKAHDRVTTVAELVDGISELL